MSTKRCIKHQEVYLCRFLQINCFFRDRSLVMGKGPEKGRRGKLSFTLANR